MRGTDARIASPWRKRSAYDVIRRASRAGRGHLDDVLAMESACSRRPPPREPIQGDTCRDALPSQVSGSPRAAARISPVVARSAACVAGFAQRTMPCRSMRNVPGSCRRSPIVRPGMVPDATVRAAATSRPGLTRSDGRAMPRPNARYACRSGSAKTGKGGLNCCRNQAASAGAPWPIATTASPAPCSRSKSRRNCVA